MGRGVGSGSIVGVGCKRVESEIVENWRGHLGNFSLLHFVFSTVTLGF